MTRAKRSTYFDDDPEYAREMQIQTYRRKVRWQRSIRRYKDTYETPKPTLGKQLAEIDRISMGGVMCSMVRYDQSKPANYPTAKEVCEEMGRSWDEIRQELGLRVRA